MLIARVLVHERNLLQQTDHLNLTESFASLNADYAGQMKNLCTCVASIVTDTGLTFSAVSATPPQGY